MDTTDHTDSTERRPDSERTVLCVDGDADSLASAASRLSDAGLCVRTETDPEQVLERLGGVDCLVSAYQLPGTDGLELLETVRETAPSLPFVLHTTASLEAVGGDLLSADWTEYVPKKASDHHTELLARRIRTVADQRRLDTAARRYRTALETSREAILVVAPDGTVAFVNDTLASELSAARSELENRRWDELFTDESVAQLRKEAFPVAADGWRWTGMTALYGHADAHLDCRASLSRLDDGSMIFAFHSLRRMETGTG
jgi:CheY-like chemotaxis protein